MKYVIYGLGVSGTSAAKYLARTGAEVIATDDNESTINNFSSTISGIKAQKAGEIAFDSNTIISFAPGIPLYFPKPHKILDLAKKNNATLACDIEIFYRNNKNNYFVGITGTNGKSTTTALTGFVFKELKISSEIGGNIGIPCFDLPNKESGFCYIFETSSYQLDLLSQTHFNIAALLNITPDHIDRHGSLEGYIAAKKRIFRNQSNEDFALIDCDNENSAKILQQLKDDKGFKANIVPISTTRIVENGVSLFDGVLNCKINGTEFSANLTSEFLRGQHNDQNMAFAFAITYCHILRHKIAISASEIISAIKKFHGLRHRMQLLGEKDGIKFINDSKATNAESTENALKAYDNIFWILGGKSKEGGINILTPYFKKIHKAYLIGDASDEFALTLEKNSVKFEKCGNLDGAFKKAFGDAKNISLSQKNILLSPACASFDQWKNFEQRGDYFCKLFDELQK